MFGTVSLQNKTKRGALDFKSAVQRPVLFSVLRRFRIENKVILKFLLNFKQISKQFVSCSLFWNKYLV